MTSRICVDASLALRWILPTAQDPMADSLLQRWDETGIDLISPPLFDTEVTSALRKQVYLKKVLPQQGEQAYLLYRELGVTVVSPPELSTKAWHLAAEYNQMTTLDMQYLAVAELEDCELWTADRRLFNSMRDRNQRIRLVGDYIGSNPTRDDRTTGTNETARRGFPGLWREI